jgi:hypothetical protein
MASMSELDAIRWFKKQFGDAITKACNGTPYNLDMATAIAMQETFADCWGKLYQTKPADVVLQLCVGDTLDYPKRGASAFPRDKAELCHAPNGQAMFDVARQALLSIAPYSPGYQSAARNPDKFCHGYGIFQYDIQFFKTDPDFFLMRGWCDIDQCIKRLIKELDEARGRIHWSAKTTLNDEEMMYVAIAYNCGSAKIGAGAKQGFFSDGKYYGENFQRYLALAHATPIDVKVALDQGQFEPDIVLPRQPDLATLVQQVLAVMQTLAAQGQQQTPSGQQSSSAAQVDQFVKLLTAFVGGIAGSSGELGQVNGALGQSIGNLLDGKKSAIGIVGAIVTAVLQAVGPSLPTTLPLVGNFAGLGSAAMPVFLAIAAWGALGKLEKWFTLAG